METIESIVESLGQNEEGNNEESNSVTAAAVQLDNLKVGESKSEGEVSKEGAAAAVEEQPKTEAKAEEASATEAKAVEASAADKA